MIAAGFVLARFVHFASLAILFGAAWSPAYVNPLPIERSLRRIRLWAAVLAIVSAVAWFELTVASMADSPSDAFDLATLWMTARATDFGHVWIARMGGLLVIFGVVAWRDKSARYANLMLSGLLIASLALTGHAQAETGAARWLHASADALHLLAAGLWLGGLVVLGLLLAVKTQGQTQATRLALRRFSTTGIVAVAVLVGTGVVNSVFLIGTPISLVTTPYGHLLAVKLVLFAGMIVLAALNRRAAARPSQLMEPFRRRVILEQILGSAVILCVALLGTMAPGAGT